MGLMDDYKPEHGGFQPGDFDLQIGEIKQVTAKSSGREGLALVFYINGNPERKMYKTYWKTQFFNQQITNLLEGMSVDPSSIHSDQDIFNNLPGRHGKARCDYGQENDQGKKFLEPKFFYTEKSGSPNQSSGGNTFADGSPVDSYAGNVPEEEIPF